MSKRTKTSKWLIIIVIIILLLLSFGKGSSSSSTNNGEVRCWYCAKVIYNNGKPIHCTHQYLNTYTCDYCEKSNVIK